MKTVAISILLAAGAMLASAAHAQTAEPPVSAPQSSPPIHDPGLSQPQWSYEPWGVDAPTDRHSIRYGVGALKAQDYTEAEAIFANVLRRKQYNADANFYLGVAKMNLGKWEEAKEPLAIAAKKKPKHPDPKSRLGVTYAKLGDIGAAQAQRAELMKMSNTCKDDCKLSPYIIAGIEMIDAALAGATSPRG